MLERIVQKPLEGTYLYPCFDLDRRHRDMTRLFSLTFTPLKDSSRSKIEFELKMQHLPPETPRYPPGEGPQLILLSTANTPHKLGYLLGRIVGLTKGEDTRPVILLAGYREELGELVSTVTAWTYLDGPETGLHPDIYWQALAIDVDALAAEMLLHSGDQEQESITTLRLSRIHTVQTEFTNWLEKKRETMERLLPEGVL